jgi:predicted enzyme related to lactoylglutathione lyase
MSRPIHFEIHADDLERAKAFYEAVFGWTYEDYSQVAGSPYWGVTTGPEDQPGINGGLMPRTESGAGVAVNGAVLTMGVEDFDATATVIEASGGRVALPKAALPGMAWQGYFLDPEGNVFGIHQPDENAA